MDTPGTSSGWTARKWPAVASRLSPHQIGVADLLDGARWRDRYPNTSILLGLVPASMELSVELSPRVRQALPGLVERVVEEARELGFTFQPEGGAGGTGGRAGRPGGRAAGRPGGRAARLGRRVWRG